MVTKDGSLLKENGIARFKRDILPMLSDRIAACLHSAELDRLDILEEVRLRAGKPLMLSNYKGDWCVGTDGALLAAAERAFIVSQTDMAKTLELMSENSVYAYQDEIRNGYITIKGGHRVGIAGKVVLEGSVIRNIKDISGLNIRLSNQVPGCSSKIVRYLLHQNTVFNTLVISPPQCGKTTVLRDLARVLSDGLPELDFNGIKVGIVDERSEIAACLRGVPQNIVGLRTDVLDGCPKSIGMAMMIRSMSPEVIITDEIGSEGDRDAVMAVLNAGVKVIASAHGYNISELKSRREVLRLMEEKVFERYVVLGNAKGPGTLVEIVDGLTMKPVPCA